MSPARSRTSSDAITAAARRILEEDGLEAVTMQAVADRVGVRAPSLYKRVADRNALVRSVVASVAADLAVEMRPSRAAGDPRDELREMAARYRTFVRANPVGYGLLFARLGPEVRPDEAALAALGDPVVASMRRIVGDDGALEAARTFVAWAHGFTSLEMTGGFRLGGDLERAYARGVELILAGISGSASPAGG